MLWRVAVGPWRRSALLVSRAVAAGVAPPSPLSSAHVRRRPHHLRPTPTTVIPAEAGIQVGFHGNERAVRGVGGHVGHHRWTRGFGVLYGGTNLDPRLRGDDGIGGVQRSADGGPDRGVACFGVWRSAEPMVPLRTARVRRCRCRVRRPLPPSSAHVRRCPHHVRPTLTSVHVRHRPRQVRPTPHHRHPRLRGDDGIFCL